MMEKDKYTVPSYICTVTVSVADRSEITDVKNLKRFSKYLINAIGMEPVGKPRVDILPCLELPGVNSISVNQPIKTSVLVCDAWPEKLDHGALVIVIHSCVNFAKKDVEKTIANYFKQGVKVVNSRHFDRTFRGSPEVLSK